MKTKKLEKMEMFIKKKMDLQSFILGLMVGVVVTCILAIISVNKYL